MDGYIIRCGGKLYATNADSMEEAEEKFVAEYPDLANEIYTVELGVVEFF